MIPDGGVFHNELVRFSGEITMSWICYVAVFLKFDVPVTLIKSIHVSIALIYPLRSPFSFGHVGLPVFLLVCRNANPDTAIR